MRSLLFVPGHSEKMMAKSLGSGADVLIFSGGIGENAAAIRAQICAGLDKLGIAIDKEANEREGHDARQVGTSSIPVWVVPTDEELLIARDEDAVRQILRTQGVQGKVNVVLTIIDQKNIDFIYVHD